MRDLKGFMNFVGVTKKKYVDDWIDKDLIPGAFRDKEKNTYSFLDSSRRPYRNSGLTPGLPADKLRTHIVKAAIARHHIFADMCFASPAEFDSMIDDLINCGLIRRRIEDGITYYDATPKCDAYVNKKLDEVGVFVKECLAVVSENVAKGVVKGALEASFTTNTCCPIS